MTKSITKRSSSVCQMCREIEVVRYLPKEVGRQVFHEEISIPGEPEPKTRKIAITRITYQRDYFCPNCKHQWSETHVTEAQKEI